MTMRRLLRLQFLRFIVVGTLNTAFSYGLYAGFVALGFSYLVASTLSFVFGLALSFRTQGALVFNNRDPRRAWRFVACWVLIYLFNIGIIGGLVRLGFDAYYAGAIALVPVTLLSYTTQRFVVFGERPKSGHASQAADRSNF